MRQEGYYWCRYGGEWIIAKFTTYDMGFDSSYSSWSFIGIDYKKHTWGCSDKDFEEIDETPIKKQN